MTTTPPTRIPRVHEAHPTQLTDVPLVVELGSRVRAILDGETVFDTYRPALAFNPDGHVPWYCIPREDVLLDLVESTEPVRNASPDASSFGTPVRLDVRTSSRLAADTAWGYTGSDAPESAARLAGYVSFRWDAMDAWYEELELLFGHARDPFHRLETRHTGRQVDVMIGGEVVGSSNHTVAVFETGLPVRWYMPRADVRLGFLKPSPTRSECAYKGEAEYFHIEVPGTRLDDGAWTYPFVSRELHDLQGRIAFFDERVDEVRIDGELLARPATQWS